MGVRLDIVVAWDVAWGHGNQHFACSALQAAWCVLLPVYRMFDGAYRQHSRNSSEGTWHARWDLSEPEEASTGATDMSGSRVEVGDVGTCGSERDQ